MENNPGKPVAQWKPGKGQSAITVVSHKRDLHVYQVTESELDNLHTAGNYKTLDIALCSLGVGVFSATLITLLTVDMKPGLTYQTFVAICGISFVATLFFGVRAVLAWRAARQELARIKRAETSA